MISIPVEIIARTGLLDMMMHLSQYLSGMVRDAVLPATIHLMFVHGIGTIVGNRTPLRPVNGKCIRIGEQLWAVRTDWSSGAGGVVLVDGRVVVRRGLMRVLLLRLLGHGLARAVGGIGVD